MTSGKQNAEYAQAKVEFFTELLERLINYKIQEGYVLPNKEDVDKCIRTAEMELAKWKKSLACSSEASYEEMHEMLKDYQS